MSINLYLDIDSTLLNTRKLFRERIRPALLEYLRVEDKELASIEEQYRSGLEKSTDFNPTHYLELLAQSFQVPLEEVSQIFFTPGFFREAVFLDVEPVLELLARKYQLGIYSEGHVVFQTQKLELSGLSKWFDNPELVLINRRKLEQEAISLVPSGSWVVDDNLEVVKRLSLEEGINVCWLRREVEAGSKSEAEDVADGEAEVEANNEKQPFVVAKNFLELLELLS
jgi:FMN phosphatase YigB (HAD superfamily)